MKVQSETQCETETQAKRKHDNSKCRINTTHETQLGRRESDKAKHKPKRRSSKHSKGNEIAVDPTTLNAYQNDINLQIPMNRTNQHNLQLTISKMRRTTIS